MNKLFKIGIVLFLLILGAGTASAAITWDNTFKYIQVSGEDVCYIEDIDDALSDTVLNETSPGVWECSGCIYVLNSNLYLNGTTATEIRLAGKSDKSKLIYNNNQATYGIYINGTTLKGWNSTSGEMEFRGGLIIYNPDIQNARFDTVTTINLYNQDSGTLSNVTLNNTRDLILNDFSDVNVNNITVTDGVATGLGAIQVQSGESLTVKDIIINGTDLTGIQVSETWNSTFYDLDIRHTGDGYANPETGHYGMVLGSGGGNVVHDFYFNDTGYSGLDTSGSETGDTFYNGFIGYAGHNGLDLHPGKNLQIYNLTVADSHDANFLATAPSPETTGNCENVTMWDITFRNAGTQLGTNVYNFTITNLTIDNGGFKTFDFAELLVINSTQTATVHNDESGWVFTGVSGQTDDAYVVDSSFWTLNSWDAANTRFVNCNWSLFYGYDDVHIYYYPNISIINTTGYPVSNATITVNTTSVNGYAENQTTFTTDENGKLYDSGNRTNWLAIPDTHWVNSSYAINYTSLITASKSGETNSTSVNPDSTFYSPDPSDLQGTSITLILDVLGEGESTGTPPTAGFTANTTTGSAPLTVQFTDLSTDATLWSWDFDNDGTPDSTEQNPIHAYNTSGVYTVNLTVSNDAGNDSEIKVDYITVTNGSLPVSAFSGTPTSGTYPLTVTFTDSSINATSWLWDFGDGNTSTDQNPANVYNSTGTYTVNLTVGNEYGNDSEVKVNYITVTEPSTPTTEEDYFGRDGSDLASSAVPVIGITVVTLFTVVALGALSRRFEVEPNQLVMMALGLLVIMVMIYLIYGIATLMENTFSILD